MIRPDDTQERITETDVLAEWWCADERTTYELVHRINGPQESWGVRWVCGFKTNQFWYNTPALAEAHFNQIKATLT